MNSVELRRPVAVKAIMTEEFRKKVINDTEAALKNHELMFKQLEELYAKNKDIVSAPMAAIDKQMEHERNRLNDIKKEMEQRIKEFKDVPDGEEIFYSVVEGVVSIKVGDDLQKILTTAEIVMKDFKVIELRGF